MNDRLLSFLGLCKRAGKLLSGAQTVEKAAAEKKLLLVLTADDLSPNSKKEAAFFAEKYGVPLRTLGRSKEELSFALGRHCGIVGITDSGFADRILSLLNDA
jgi:ribosomal protein L7Ae-like RNA K-turn-binding protein